MKGFGVQDVGICDPRTESLGLNVRGVQDVGRFEWSAFGRDARNMATCSKVTVRCYSSVPTRTASQGK